jgi:hypothetical protein
MSKVTTAPILTVTVLFEGVSTYGGSTLVIADPDDEPDVVVEVEEPSFFEDEQPPRIRTVATATATEAPITEGRRLDMDTLPIIRLLEPYDSRHRHTGQVPRSRAVSDLRNYVDPP